MEEAERWTTASGPGIVDAPASSAVGEHEPTRSEAGLADRPEEALVDSFASDALGLTAGLADVGLDALIDSGGLDGVPVVGLLAGVYKAGRHVPALLYQRKVARFLAGLTEASPEEREEFVSRLREEGELQRFGEVVLLLVDKADDLDKPIVIGRIMAAHVRGLLSREEAVRLASVVNRTFSGDLEFLKSFRFGTGYRRRHVVAALAAVGVVEDRGTDGGEFDRNDPESGGGQMYALGGQGIALLTHGYGLVADYVAEVDDAGRVYEERHRPPPFLLGHDEG